MNKELRRDPRTARLSVVRNEREPAEFCVEYCGGKDGRPGRRLGELLTDRPCWGCGIVCVRWGVGQRPGGSMPPAAAT